MWFPPTVYRKFADRSGSTGIPVALGILWLVGTAGCGGGGGNGGNNSGNGGTSSGKPTGLAAGTPATVAGSAANRLAFTFSESLMTLNGAPAVTYALHEVNNGPASVDVVAAANATTQDLYPILNVQIRDPQNHALSVPHYTGSQTLTLMPGDSADTSLTFPLSDFPQKGRYSATATSTGTESVPALATPLILTAN